MWSKTTDVFPKSTQWTEYGFDTFGNGNIQAPACKKVGGTIYSGWKDILDIPDVTGNIGNKFQLVCELVDDGSGNPIPNYTWEAI